MFCPWQVMDLRKRAANLPDDYLVVFVGEGEREACASWPASAALWDSSAGQHDTSHSAHAPIRHSRGARCHEHRSQVAPQDPGSRLPVWRSAADGVVTDWVSSQAT